MAVIFRDAQQLATMRPRIKRDVYHTDPRLANATVAFLDRLVSPLRFERILDPGAGRGVWGKALACALPYATHQIEGVELRRIARPPHYNNWMGGLDYLSPITPVGRYDLIIGNPPFDLAEAFIQRSRPLLSGDGLICFLLPADFAHGQGRGRGLFTRYRPRYHVSLMQRPNFTGPRGESLGTANTDNYILMIWKQTSARATTHLRLDWKRGVDELA